MLRSGFPPLTSECCNWHTCELAASGFFLVRGKSLAYPDVLRSNVQRYLHRQPGFANKRDSGYIR